MTADLSTITEYWILFTIIMSQSTSSLSPPIINPPWFEYVGPVDRLFLCSVCLDVLKEPCVHNACRNTFCAECIIPSSNGMTCCPLCRQQCSISAYTPAALMTLNLLDQLQVQCTKIVNRPQPHQCTHQCKRSELAFHQRTCNTIPCPRGCGVRLNDSVQDIAAHEKDMSRDGCAEAIVKCQIGSGLFGCSNPCGVTCKLKEFYSTHDMQCHYKSMHQLYEDWCQLRGMIEPLHEESAQPLKIVLAMIDDPIQDVMMDRITDKLLLTAERETNRVLKDKVHDLQDRLDAQIIDASSSDDVQEIFPIPTASRKRYRTRSNRSRR